MFVSRAILYADTMTGSLERAISETNRRRTLQVAANREARRHAQDYKKKFTTSRRRCVPSTSVRINELLVLDTLAYK